ncbi:MAG: HlyD family efflux transporter periplasmic adaptor subunit [Planctomycetes bacterium]|nr:HlyD family efflux transporter periplasmic adaptor subunit [Planctomycetota bacterium]
MESVPHIPTPWSHRWRRFRSQGFPAFVFVGAAVLTVWLWDRQAGVPMLVGEVQAIRFDVSGQVDGMLVTLPHRQLEPFDVVMAGEIVAKLDDGPVLASLAALQADRLRVEQELTATDARLRQAEADRQHEHMDEARRLAVDLERLRLEVVDRKAQLETDGIALRRLDEEYEALRAIHAGDAETQFRLTISRLQRDEVAQRIAGNTKALAEAEAHTAAAIERTKNQPTPAPAYVREQLAPIRAAIAAQEARIRELEIQVQWLEIRSPIRGTVSAIYYRPGQVARAGDPVLTVVDGHSRHIIAYVRQRQGLEPKVGMEVAVRNRSLPRQVVRTLIDRVGDQIEPVPLHHLRNPNLLEWGLPVRIALPEELALRPGELVDLTFTY